MKEKETTVLFTTQHNQGAQVIPSSSPDSLRHTAAAVIVLQEEKMSQLDQGRATQPK